MELTDKVFRHLQHDLSARQEMTVRAALCDGRYGILPEGECHVNAAFVKRRLELTGLRLDALTPQGTIISVDDDLALEIPQLKGDEYFLCVEETGEMHRFERDGIPYAAPAYQLVLREAQEMADLGAGFPVRHLTIKDGALNIDAEYILPCLSLASDSRFEEYHGRLTDLLEAIANHVNMDEGDCKRTLLALLFRMRSFQMQRQVRDYTELLQEVAQAVRYYVIGQLAKTLENCPQQPLALDQDARQKPVQHNIAAFLQWMVEYLTAQQEIMAQVVIVDNSIDYEKLKAELREDIYNQLHEELYDKMRAELHDSLTEELTEDIMAKARSLMQDELAPALRQELTDSLLAALRDLLHDSLYQELYDALYRPTEENGEEFMPLI